VLVPDNLKSGVSKACKYEPELNPTYADMAEHYGCAVLPARPREPRNKAKAEAGVLIAKRWILAVLRHRTFYSLAELNAAIRECLERLNTRPLKRLKKSHRELFEAIDRPMPCRCLKDRTSTPNGTRLKYSLTTTSRWTTTITACLTGFYTRGWISG
jgi:hypothetical protein